MWLSWLIIFNNSFFLIHEFKKYIRFWNIDDIYFRSNGKVHWGIRYNRTSMKHHPSQNVCIVWLLIVIGTDICKLFQKVIDSSQLFYQSVSILIFLAQLYCINQDDNIAILQLCLSPYICLYIIHWRKRFSSFLKGQTQTWGFAAVVFLCSNARKHAKSTRFLADCYKALASCF